MNDFRQITAIAVDCLNPGPAAQALEHSMAQCDFADALLLTDTPVPTQARVQTIPPIRSRRDYSRFALQQMAAYVTTPYLLIVQWDGFVLDARQWNSEFLQWDYIGAPWPGPNGPRVGNGGFCLRSRRLLDALADPVFQAADVELEDHFICQVQRAMLERRYGLRFAPAPLAHRFAYESYAPTAPTFGFHGLQNLARHCSQTHLLALAQALHADTFKGNQFIGLLTRLMGTHQFSLAQHLLRLALERMAGPDPERGLETFRQVFKQPVDGNAFVRTCQQLLAMRLPAL